MIPERYVAVIFRMVKGFAIIENRNITIMETSMKQLGITAGGYAHAQANRIC